MISLQESLLLRVHMKLNTLEIEHDKLSCMRARIQSNAFFKQMQISFQS